MKRMAAALVILMAILAGCSGGGAESEGAGAAELEQRAGDAEGVAAEPAADDEAAAAGGAAADEQVGAGGGGRDVLLTAGLGDRIVRNGTMRVQVDQGAFDRAFEQLVGLADRYGGTVLASDVTTADDASTAGTVTIRVPSEDFDALLVAAGRVGDVQHRSITSEDVSNEFVDLEARLRHNQAQERFYLSLLEEAQDIEDAIAVQQRVEGIQQTIEQIQGRLRFLEERTSFSRLTIELFEVGGVFQAGGPAQPSFARYWAAARAALINTLGGALVIATVALPFVVVGAAVYWLGRRYGLPRRRQTAADA